MIIAEDEQKRYTDNHHEKKKLAHLPITLEHPLKFIKAVPYR
jgi:hypothetical protein